MLRSISTNEVCTGVSGRVKDYGITNVGLLSDTFSNSELKYDEKKDSYKLTINNKEAYISLCSSERL